MEKRGIDNDELLLKEFFAAHSETIADNGFTERVLAALPQEQEGAVRLRQWNLVLNGTGILAVVGMLVALGTRQLRLGCAAGAVHALPPPTAGTAAVCPTNACLGAGSDQPHGSGGRTSGEILPMNGFLRIFQLSEVRRGLQSGFVGFALCVLQLVK